MPFFPGLYGIEWGRGTVNQKKGSGSPISKHYFLNIFFPKMLENKGKCGDNSLGAIF